MLDSLFTTVHLNTISLITAIVCGLRALRSSKWFLASVGFFPSSSGIRHPAAGFLAAIVFCRVHTGCYHVPCGSLAFVIWPHVTVNIRASCYRHNFTGGVKLSTVRWCRTRMRVGAWWWSPSVSYLLCRCLLDNVTEFISHSHSLTTHTLCLYYISWITSTRP